MKILLLFLVCSLVICALYAALSKKLLSTIIVYTAYSIIMSIIWLLLRSPDLAITEAAVGAGVTGILFFLTLRRIREIRDDFEEEEARKDHSNNEAENNGGDNKDEKNK